MDTRTFNLLFNTMYKSMEKQTLIIIDNGHGKETKGKCSPGAQLQEWAWARKSARVLAGILKASGFRCSLLVPEDYDVSLGERCQRANKLHAQNGGRSVLISLHCNASGNGVGYTSASGFSCYVHPAASVAAKELATKIWDKVAEEAAFKGNRWRPSAGYMQANFAILRGTAMPAVLLECLFMDNMNDITLLLEPSWQNRLMQQVAAAVEDVCK